MLLQKVKYRFYKRLPKIALAIAVIFSLIALSVVFLFFVNRFTLVLTPVGDEKIILEYGQAYADPGVEAKLVGSVVFRSGFSVEAPVIIQGDVDPGTVGSYQVTYTGKYHYWEAQTRRQVQIVDTQAPWITLESKPGSFTVSGGQYQEEGFSAYDEYDGDLTEQVQREEKDGFVIYRVEDSSGNVTQIGRKIRYFDPVPPEITLSGDTTIYLDSGTAYQEPGYAASDNCDGDLSSSVTIEGSVDKYLSGTYRLTYSVRDSSGNVATAQRTVIVVPRPQPDTFTPSGKVIYLTFDDGPGPYTKQLLDTLKAYNVKATFFVIDSDYTHLLSRIVEEGHAIGIHSVTHDYASIYSSSEAFFEDLLKMQSIIKENTGINTTLMRFPGGSSNTVSKFSPGIMTYLTEAVEDMGFQYFDWNVDSNDAGGARDAETVYENVCSGVSNNQISVVLQHDIKDFSVEAVEKIINWGIDNGYVFLPLSSTSPETHHGVNN